MNSRSLTDKLIELRSLNLGNRLVFDYRPPAKMKENNEPLTQDEAEDRFYKDYIKPEEEAKLILQYQLPEWNEDLKSFFLEHWPRDKCNELFDKEDYIEPLQFLSAISACISYLLVTSKYLTDEIKRNKKLDPKGLAQTFCHQANEVLKHCDFFQEYVGSLKFSDVNGMPDNVVKTYTGYQIKVKTFYDEVKQELLKSNNFIKNQDVNIESFVKFFIDVNQIKLLPENKSDDGSKQQYTPN